MNDWHALHEHFVSVGRAGAKQDHALCKAVVQADRALLWEPVGMTSLSEYSERYAGLTPRQTEDRLRVGFALEGLPLLDDAFARGLRFYSAVRELTRVATPETEARWMERTENVSVGDIEKMVSGREPGDLPEDPQRSRRHRVLLDLSAEAYALFREAQAKIRRDADGPLTDDDSISLMARQVLGGPGDDGRSSYQIHMTMCPSCGRAEQEGRGQSLPVDDVAAEVASCDAQRFEGTGPATQDIPPAIRRLVLARQHGRCGIPGCRSAIFIDVHHVHLRSEGGTHDPELLLAVCSAHHRALHAGAIRVDGTWSTGFVFTHADGSAYGSAAKAKQTALLVDAHQALRSFQFSERQTRTIMESIRPHVGANTTLEDVVRMGLAAARAATAH